MKTFHFGQSWVFKLGFLGLALLLMAPMASGFSDDFDDGNDDGWTHLDPLGKVGLAGPASYRLEQGGYRLMAPPPGSNAGGPARAFSYIAGESYTDFYCAVDVLDWNDEINQAFGILGRAGNLGLGQTTGYVCNYNPNQTGSRPGGQFQINKVTGEASEATITAADIKLIAEKSYRFVFIGEGNRLIGMIFDLDDLTRPLVSMETDGAQDPLAVDYPVGVCGLFNFYRGNDLLEPHAVPDSTFDNFVLEKTNPNPELLPGVGHSVEGIAQVIHRKPVSGANFYPAHEGIEFTVTTLTAASPDAALIKLLVNGDNVSDQLKLSAEDGLKVRYHGLEPNKVYDVVIELGEGGATNRFQFDTFDPLFFDSGEVIVIEAEDYNFNGGQFQDDPKPSGISLNGDKVNGRGVGYFELAGQADIDFSEIDGGPQGRNDYRPDDPVGLRPGSDQVAPGPVIQDTPRAKFVDTGAQDYQVHRTEAGEWLNYTRNFAASEYQIYLRVASRASQSVRLDRVTSESTRPNQSTETIGAFAVPNQVTPQSFQLIPLTDAAGNPVVAALDGVTTLRLTMDAPEADFASKYVLYMNYLAFVPLSRDEPNLSISLGGIFGDLGENAPETTVSIPVRNSATTETLTITQATIRGEDRALYQVVSKPDSLAPGESGDIVVTFSRAGREGVFIGELVLSSNDQTSAEIVVDLTAAVPLASKLLLHYAMDESEGVIAQDKSGMRRHGRYQTSAGARIQLGQAGIASGSSVRLSESDNGAAFIEIPREAGLAPLNAFTASIWLQSNGTDPQGTLLSKGTQAADPFAIAVSGKAIAWGAASEQVLQSDNVLPDLPTHIVLTYEKMGETAEVAIFVDGVEVARDATGPAFNDSAPSAMQIGALNGSLGLSGLIDDFQLYGRVLSIEEIALLEQSPGQVIGGTDPSGQEPDASKIQEVARVGNALQITFTSEPNQSYVVQTSDDLTQESWTTLSNVVGAGLPATVTTASLTMDGSVNFFRIGLAQ